MAEASKTNADSLVGRLVIERGLATHEEVQHCLAVQRESDNGDAAGTTLLTVDVAVELGAGYLDDDHYEYSHDGGLEDTDGDDDDDDLPDSTSHIGF